MNNAYKGLFLATFFLTCSLFAQQIETGTPTARRSGIHDGNQVKTVFSNSAVIAQPGALHYRGAWKFRKKWLCR